ncbi:MAG: NAD(P)H-dependent oxidoreductase [Candidatus Paceibacterota bacterium]|jgi:nitroreductase
MKKEEIISALNWRYAVKTFDAAKKVSDADLNTILESGRLSPSSFGIEPWKFIVVTNPEIRAKIRAASWDQTKVTDASHLVVVARRTDAPALSPELIARTAKAQGKTETDLAEYKGMVDNALTGRLANPAVLDGWIASQTYVALGIMAETAALLDVDACPMEGFDPSQINAILGLSAKNLSATTMLALGYRGADDYAKAPKTRRPFEEVVEFVA